jgi:transcriptional regulator with XRE-family HTH domain
VSLGRIVRHTDIAVNRCTELFGLEYGAMVTTPQFATFGARLRYWRERRGFKKQGDFADKLGIKQPSLSELESGESKSPSADILLKAADLLQLRPKYLLSGEGAPESRSFSDLNGLEAQLVMIFRQLPTDALRDALLIDANDMLNRAGSGAPSPADPFAGRRPIPSPDDVLRKHQPAGAAVKKSHKKVA